MEEEAVSAFSVSDMPHEVRTKVTNLNIKIDNNRIRLEGVAVSYYIKQKAQEAVRQILPGVLIDNQISVDY